MGAVYIVEHINTGGLWALKVMLDCTKLQGERAARFRREARASARITSEHVVKVTDADTAPELDGAPFIVMELLDGQDVERLLNKCGRLEAREAIDILTQVARGLDKAHAAGVIHRDLKPENIFVHRREDGSTIVKVLDFGISKVLRPDGDIASASVTGAADVMGTPLYMAPEQATARHDQVGPATDVWAIGLMAVRMLTGSIYWKGDTIAEVFVQIMSESRWPPSSRWPELGAAFDAWFVKSCSLRPADRFQSVGEQISELSVVLTGERAQLKSSSPSATPPANDSRPPPQLVTQILNADKLSQSSSARPMAMGVSTSTGGPVTSAAIPLKPARGLAVGAAVLLVAVVGFVGVSLLRGRDTANLAGADASSASASSVAALGLPTPSGTSASSPAADAGLAVAPTSTTTLLPNEPLTAPTASAPVHPSGPQGTGGVGGAVVGQVQPQGGVKLGVAPQRPVQPPVTPPTTPAPPPTTPTTTTTTTTKPAGKGDLFDTQK